MGISFKVDSRQSVQLLWRRMCLKMLCVVALVCVVQNALAWNYANQGEGTEWNQGKCSGGSRQSPVNFDMKEGVEDIKFRQGRKIVSHNYMEEVGSEPAKIKYTMRNNGHALQIDLPGNTPYKMRTGVSEGATQGWIPLYILIHFDQQHGKGSEHTVDKKSYFAEIQIVHRNSKYKVPGSRSSWKGYLGHDDGLLVLSMFVDKVPRDHILSQDLDYFYKWSINPEQKKPNQGTSFAMQVFKVGAKKCPNSGSPPHELRSFKLGWMLPSTCRSGNVYEGYEYVTYKGSLTTPPCSENVAWFVITGKTHRINSEDAKVFTFVNNADGEKMNGNRRHVQELKKKKDGKKEIQLVGVHGALN